MNDLTVHFVVRIERLWWFRIGARSLSLGSSKKSEFSHSLCFLFFVKDVTDTPSRKKRSSSHREEGETTETFVAQMTVFDKNRYDFVM